MSQDEQQEASGEEPPIEKLLAEVEDHYNKDTSALVLEYLFISLIGLEEYNRFETIKRAKKYKEEDYLRLSRDTFSM